MAGLYSYNLLDHPDFLRAQRIEKRIIRYNRRQLAARQSIELENIPNSGGMGYTPR